MGKRVLVVGGAGYIGAHFAHLLDARGVEVVVLDDLSTGHAEAAVGQLVVGDLRDAALLRDTFARWRFDAVVHFAAKALVGESMRAPALYHDVNVRGTAALAQAMVEAGVLDLVFSSSCSVYGAPAQVPVDEHQPTAPLSPYAASKLAAEQGLARVGASHGLRTVNLRYFNAAGAHPEGLLGESHDPETHLIPRALLAVLGRAPPLTLFGRDYDTSDGTCVRDYVHVMDLAEAHLAALTRLERGPGGGTWNLGAGRGRSVLEVLDAIHEVTGRHVPLVEGPRRPGDPPEIWARVDAARDALGWSPRCSSLHEIVETAWRWARAPRF